MIMCSLKQNLEYILGTSVVQVFPSWQEDPVSMLHKDHSIIYSKPLEKISSLKTKIIKKNLPVAWHL